MPAISRLWIGRPLHDAVTRLPLKLRSAGSIRLCWSCRAIRQHNYFTQLTLDKQA